MRSQALWLRNRPEWLTARAFAQRSSLLAWYPNSQCPVNGAQVARLGSRATGSGATVAFSK